MFDSRYLFSLLLLFFLLPIQSATAGEDAGWFTNLAAAEKAAKESGKPLMVDLWAPWCAPCKKLAKVTFTDPMVSPLFEGFILAKIDVMEEAHQDLAAESLPKVYFAKSDGVELPAHTLNKFEAAEPFAARLAKTRQALGMPAIGEVAAAPPLPKEDEGKSKSKTDAPHPVNAKFVLEKTAYKPGEKSLAALHLSMDKGWHVYWHYPSTSELGEPIAIDWKESEALQMGSILWPAPLEFTDFGEFTTFGYKEEAVLLVPFELSATSKAGDNSEIQASVSWLVCNEGNCIPKTVELTLSVPVGEETVSAPAESPFSAWSAKVAPQERQNISVTSPSVEASPGKGFLVEYEIRGDKGIKLSPPPEHKYEKSIMPFTHRDISIQDRKMVLDEDGTLRISLGGLVGDSLSLGDKVHVGAVIRYLENDKPVLLEVRSPMLLSANGMAAGGLGGGTDGPDVALWEMLLFALIGGLLLNIMPCVLPVLSIKAMGLVNQAGEDEKVIWHHGLAYGAGVILSFLGLAGFVVALKLSGDLVGWGFQFQNPVFVAILLTLIFGFSLSLFGVYEISAPGMQAAHKASSKGGLSGSFFNGAFATLLATPCTAPFLGPAMGFAFSQSAGIIFLMFAVVGLGLALPFVLLARFPAWIKRIPKPGPWMEHFKHVMGFLLVATVVWLLDVIGHMITPRSMTGIFGLLAAISLAAWAYGKFASFMASGRQQWFVTLSCLALILFTGYHTLSVEELGADAGGVEQADGWENFSEERIDALQAEGKTIFIDFTAKWCITCKANEQGVLETDAIQEEMKKMGVVPMIADNTRKNPVINSWLRRFNRSGVPLYVVLPGDPSKKPIVLPEILTKGLVLDALAEAGPSRL